MNNFRLLRLLVLLSSLLLAPFQVFAIDPAPNTTRLLASQCAQCHGTTGNTLGGFDSIAGESFQELYSELLEMKADNDNEIMHKQIKAYTDDQIFFIADYYSSLPENPNGDDSGDFGDSDAQEDSDELLSKEEVKAAKKREKEAKKRAKKEAKVAKKREKEAKKAAKKLEKEARKRAKAEAKAAKKREKEARKRLNENS